MMDTKTSATDVYVRIIAIGRVDDNADEASD